MGDNLSVCGGGGNGFALDLCEMDFFFLYGAAESTQKR